MIIELLLDCLYRIFSLLTEPIKIYALPDNILETAGDIFLYVINGVQIVGNFIDLQVAGYLFIVIVSVDVGLSLYHFVMWILKKIPMLGIS